MQSTLLGQHYTNDDVAHRLAALLQVPAPNRVLDLAVGHGSLLLGARALWAGAQLQGIDIDPHSLQVAQEKIGNVELTQLDCLSPFAKAVLAPMLASADVVLCNPPFIDGATKGAQKNVAPLWSQATEVQFFEISLELLRPKGSLGIILPARYISGPAYRAFRERLLNTCHVVSVTHLPHETFPTAQVDTYFVVLRKDSPSPSVTLQKLGKDGQICGAIQKSAVDLILRMDWAFHVIRTANSLHEVPLALLLTQDVRRGRIAFQRKQPNAVFHTTHFKATPASGICFDTHENVAEMGDGAIAIPGDILIPRVGSRCLHYCAIVQKGQGLFSDCIYQLRVHLDWQSYVFEYLSSSEGVELRQRYAHGSCVKILGKETLLNLPIPMNIRPSEIE